MPWCTVTLERVEIRDAMSDSGVFVCQLILSVGRLMMENSDPSPSVLFRRNVIPTMSQMVVVVCAGGNQLSEPCRRCGSLLVARSEEG